MEMIVKSFKHRKNNQKLIYFILNFVYAIPILVRKDAVDVTFSIFVYVVNFYACLTVLVFLDELVQNFIKKKNVPPLHSFFDLSLEGFIVKTIFK